MRGVLTNKTAPSAATALAVCVASLVDNMTKKFACPQEGPLDETSKVCKHSAEASYYQDVGPYGRPTVTSTQTLLDTMRDPRYFATAKALEWTEVCDGVYVPRDFQRISQVDPDPFVLWVEQVISAKYVMEVQRLKASALFPDTFSMSESHSRYASELASEIGVLKSLQEFVHTVGNRLADCMEASPSDAELDSVCRLVHHFADIFGLRSSYEESVIMVLRSNAAIAVDEKSSSLAHGVVEAVRSLERKLRNTIELLEKPLDIDSLRLVRVGGFEFVELTAAYLSHEGNYFPAIDVYACAKRMNDSLLVNALVDWRTSEAMPVWVGRGQISGYLNYRRSVWFSVLPFTVGEEYVRDQAKWSEFIQSAREAPYFDCDRRDTGDKVNHENFAYGTSVIRSTITAALDESFAECLKYLRIAIPSDDGDVGQPTDPIEKFVENVRLLHAGLLLQQPIPLELAVDGRSSSDCKSHTLDLYCLQMMLQDAATFFENLLEVPHVHSLTAFIDGFRAFWKLAKRQVCRELTAGLVRYVYHKKDFPYHTLANCSIRQGLSADLARQVYQYLESNINQHPVLREAWASLSVGERHQMKHDVLLLLLCRVDQILAHGRISSELTEGVKCIIAQIVAEYLTISPSLLNSEVDAEVVENYHDGQLIPNYYNQEECAFSFPINQTQFSDLQ